MAMNAANFLSIPIFINYSLIFLSTKLEYSSFNADFCDNFNLCDNFSNAQLESFKKFAKFSLKYPGVSLPEMNYLPAKYSDSSDYESENEIVTSTIVSSKHYEQVNNILINVIPINVDNKLVNQASTSSNNYQQNELKSSPIPKSFKSKQKMQQNKLTKNNSESTIRTKDYNRSKANNSLKNTKHKKQFKTKSTSGIDSDNWRAK